MLPRWAHNVNNARGQRKRGSHNELQLGEPFSLQSTLFEPLGARSNIVSTHNEQRIYLAPTVAAESRGRVVADSKIQTRKRWPATKFSNVRGGGVVVAAAHSVKMDHSSKILGARSSQNTYSRGFPCSGAECHMRTSQICSALLLGGLHMLRSPLELVTFEGHKIHRHHHHQRRP